MVKEEDIIEWKDNLSKKEINKVMERIRKKSVFNNEQHPEYKKY